MKSRHFFSCLALIALAGCSAGGASSQTALPQSVPAQDSAVQAPASMTVTIPPRTQGSARGAQTVDPSTQSIVILVNSQFQFVFNTTISSPYCVNSGGVTCTLAFQAPAGLDTFTVMMFQGPNGTGCRSQIASTTANLLPHQSNVINISVSGNSCS